MQQALYSNNATSTLATGISETDTSIVLASGDGAKFSTRMDGRYGIVQAITLFDPVTKNMEIVYGTSREWFNPSPASDTINIIRSQENTTAQSWPAGTVVEARLTAGMMDLVLQNNALGEESISVSTSGTTTALANESVGLNASVYASRGWVIGGVPHLRRDDWWYPADFSHYNGPDTTCTTPFVDLGNGVPWSAGSTYTDGAVVVPIVPNGLQYHLYHGEYNPDAQPNTITTGNAEPVWPLGDGDSVEDTGSGVYAEWICVDVSANGFSMDIPSNFVFYPAEIGFICFNYANVTAPPSISVGTTEDPTLFVNNQPLSNITGAHQRQGFTGFKHGVSTAMKFKASTPAAGVNSQFHGRFYIKGTFVQKQG